jgi:hypothetical protein
MKLNRHVLGIGVPWCKQLSYNSNPGKIDKKSGREAGRWLETGRWAPYWLLSFV